MGLHLVGPEERRVEEPVAGEAEKVQELEVQGESIALLPSEIQDDLWPEGEAPGEEVEPAQYRANLTNSY